MIWSKVKTWNNSCLKSHYWLNKILHLLIKKKIKKKNMYILQKIHFVTF